MLSLLFLTLIAQQVLSASSSIPPFTKHAILDPDGDFQISWSYDKDFIYAQYQAKSKGWAGLGFSPNGAMTGADIALFWIDTSGKAFVSDRHASQNGFPPEDKHQDYDLLEATKNSTHISVTFKRKINTCDPEDWPLGDDTTRVIYAMNDEIPVDKNNFQKHTNRGSKSLHFFDNKPVSPDGVPPEPGATPLDFLVHNVAIPDNSDTLYYCEFMAIPKLTTKKHVIKMEPLIQPENHDVVHHFLLYICAGFDASKYVGQGANCFDYSNPLAMAFGQCQTFVLSAWAVGGQSVVYPDNIGIPLYNPDEKLYVMMEMHYDNSQFKKGKVDSSGMRLWLTDKLRPIDGGQANFGLDVYPSGQILPPAITEMKNYGYCSARCTDNLPKDGIKVMGGLLHTHLAGRKVRLLHYRNGVQLPHVFDDEFFDFNYQDNRRLTNPITILPGDELVVECTYSTTDRTTTTFAGISTHDEMCLVYIDYYPAAYDGFVCISRPDQNTLMTAFDSYNPVNGTIDACAGQDLLTCIKNYKWTKHEADKILDLQRNGKHSAVCLRQNFVSGTGPIVDIHDEYGYVNYTTPWNPPDTCKKGASSLTSTLSVLVSAIAALLLMK